MIKFEERVKSYRAKLEKVGRSKFAGSRYVFAIEESCLGDLLRRKVRAQVPGQPLS
ncbi:MAG: hypothetical protein JRN27_03175 [Nitrososphaerota archaeon]|nr:hypothetical protein [Nitrososphaerota archaeon]MDG6973643.1 hypothetical protein [Nitrososphaerota archaeon]MDG6975082.1 hypothetical protein [Nitrososphaerota archaeon]